MGNIHDQIINEYETILDVYIRCINLFKGTQFPVKEFYAWNGLVFRIAAHSASARVLVGGINIQLPNARMNFGDGSVIHVLSRSIIEIYAMLYYLFIDSNSSGDERIFRFTYHEYQGLKIRQNMGDSSVVEEMKENQKYLDNILKIIQSTSFYIQSKPEIQRNIRKGKYNPSKTDLIISSGFSRRIAKIKYSVASDYVHGGYLSSLIAGTSITAQKQRELAYTALFPIMIVLSLCITKIMKKFPAMHYQFTDREEKLISEYAAKATDDSAYDLSPL